MGRAPSHGEELLEWRVTAVGGRTVSYGVGGSGPPLVFLHGWAVSNRTYKAALKRLVRTHRVVAPALPGFDGTEPLASSAADVAAFAAWLDAFLTAQGLGEPAILVGHSFGGAVAIQAAHDFPDRVRALVLLNSIGGSEWRRDESIVRAMRERPLWDWGIHFTRDLRPDWQIRRVLPVILRDAVMNALRHPREVWRVAHLARTADLTAELQVLRDRRLPVVVVWGEQDTVVTGASIEALVDALGEPHVVTVGGRHSWLLADPDEFGEVMTNVLAIAETAASSCVSRGVRQRRRHRRRELR